MIGVTLSIHPASIMVGTNTYIESQRKWTRWNGYIIFVLLLFVMDMFLTNAVYLAFYDIYGNLMNIGHLGVDFMDIFFSESFQIVVAVLFLLVLFQVLGLVDVAHGERNLAFYYSQVEEGKEQPSWMERYMEKREGVAGGKYNRTPIHAVDEQEEYVDIYCLRCVVQGVSYASQCTGFTRYQPHYAH